MIRSRAPLVEAAAASPALTAPPPDADAACAFSSAAAIGAASRPGRARTLLLRGSHDLTCSTWHQHHRLLLPLVVDGPVTTRVRGFDGRARNGGCRVGSRRASGRAEGTDRRRGVLAFLVGCVGFSGALCFSPFGVWTGLWATRWALASRALCIKLAAQPQNADCSLLCG